MRTLIIFCMIILSNSVQAQRAVRLDDSIKTRLIPPTGHTGAVEDACFSPDGKLVVTGSSDGTSKLWDTRTGLLIDEFTGPGAGGHVRYSPDGSQILTANSGGGIAVVRNAATGRLIHILDGNHHNIKSVEYSPNGRYLATAGLGPVKVMEYEHR